MPEEGFELRTGSGVSMPASRGGPLHRYGFVVRHGDCEERMCRVRRQESRPAALLFRQLLTKHLPQSGFAQWRKKRPMLAKGYWFANRSTSFSSLRRIFMANGSWRIDP